MVKIINGGETYGKDVRCSVTTCAYHDSNNKCLANEIKVSKCNCSSM
ncbi:MAG: DUF1540 domain-containing protein [Faecalibacillus faecis]